MADHRQARAEATRQALMLGAERLISERGLAAVTIRDILTVAEQKNTSALQYHFTNLQGLIAAIHTERSKETQAKRVQLQDELLCEVERPTLRQICQLMVQPTFDLARARVDYRRYIKAFGHELVLTEASALSPVNRRDGDGVSGERLTKQLRAALAHLDEAA